ncbi:MAG TPA: lysophospholipid acyltransferase family protein [Fimbriimonas sp.]|nr:lysophospholipid acyltransferase family protein [Fimbriimonas sp.]
MDSFPLIYRVATGLFRHIVFPLRGGAKARGLDRVPVEGGMILASIHMSWLDPPALAATLKKRRLRAFAKEELWKNKLFGRIIEGIGAFPVKRGEGDLESIRKCISILQGGEAVIVFPEGTRNDGVTMNPLQSGVAMLAKKANVPVVPAGICGTQKEGKGRVTVVYGDPFFYGDVAPGASEKETRQLFLRELESRIQSLCAEAGLTLKTSDG